MVLLSVNPAFPPDDPERTGEERVATHLADLARKRGFKISRQAVLLGKKNLLVRLKSSDKAKRRILLFPYLDVVPAEDNQFKPRVKNVCLHGHGAWDTTGFVAAFFHALLEFTKDKRRPAETEILFEGLVDEKHRQLGSQVFGKRRNSPKTATAYLQRPTRRLKTPISCEWRRAMNIGIVGAGIFGIVAALELCNRGHDVTLFDRGEIPNPEASSTDVSKIIRRTNYPNETYVELVTRAAEQWRIWHDRLGRSIYYQIGKFIIVRDFGPEHEALSGYETLIRLGKDISKLTTKEARERFPQFSVRDDDMLFHDRWAGYLRSGQAVADLAQLARDEGVVVRENTPVAGVSESGDTAQVVLPSESLSFDRAIVAAGPWVAALLPHMEGRIRITRQQMAFFMPKDAAPFKRGRFPVWSILSPGNLWYGFPFLHEGFVKVAEDSKVDDTTVGIERTPTATFLDWACEFVAERIPRLSAGELVGGRSCLYTNMANMVDEEFVIDWAPGYQRVLIAGCGCGHGFKFGGSIGPVIADALEDRDNPLGAMFKIGTRFGEGVSDVG